MQITEEEEQKMIARSRKKYEWDRVAWMKVEMDEAREEGRAEGLAEARAEGISIGEKRGRSVRNMEIAQNLMRLGLPLDQIITATGIAREEAEHLHKAPL